MILISYSHVHISYLFHINLRQCISFAITNYFNSFWTTSSYTVIEQLHSPTWKIIQKLLKTGEHLITLSIHCYLYLFIFFFINFINIFILFDPRDRLISNRITWFYLILSYIILSYLILSYLILSCLILSYLILSYLILPPILISNTIHNPRLHYTRTVHQP